MIESREGYYYLLVQKNLAQKVRTLIGDLHIKGTSFLVTDDDRLGVPFRALNPEEVASLVSKHLHIVPDVIPCEHELVKPKLSIPEKVEEICMSFLTRVDRLDLRSEIPKHWEMHGDIVLFAQSCFAAGVWSVPDHRREAEVMFDSLCAELNVKKLAKKSTIRDDDFRSPKVELLYGFTSGQLFILQLLKLNCNSDWTLLVSDSEDTWARRTENGIVHSWDITRSMFSVGNITEKMRVAQFDCRGNK